MKNHWIERSERKANQLTMSVMMPLAKVAAILGIPLETLMETMSAEEMANWMEFE